MQYILRLNRFRKFNEMYKILMILFQKNSSASGVTIQTCILCVANELILWAFSEIFLTFAFNRNLEDN